MIDFPYFTFEANQPRSPVYGMVCRRFCLVPPCATRVRSLRVLPTVTVSNVITLLSGLRYGDET